MAKQSFRAAMLCLFALHFMLLGCPGPGKPNAGEAAAATDTIPDVSAEPDDNDLLRVLQGIWQSEDDGAYLLEIADTRARHRKNGATVAEAHLDVVGSCKHLSCPDSVDTSDGWCFIETRQQGGAQAVQCFFVERCDTAYLRYRPLDGVGRVLSFKKIK